MSHAIEGNEMIDEHAKQAANKAVVERFFAGLGDGRQGDIGAIVAPDYAPHLPDLAGLPTLLPGRDALIARLQGAGPIPHHLYRIVADGDFVFAQVRYDSAVPVSGADIFRLDSSNRIAEHWSARQAIPDDAAKGIDRFAGGGDTAATTSPARREEIRRIAHEVLDIWRQADADAVSRYYDDGYIQRNPDMPGGAERIREVFKTDLKAYIAATGGPFPVECHRLGVEGDLIFIHYSVFMAGINRSAGARSTNIDIFRIDGADRMVEHWDVLQIEGEAAPDAATLF